MSLSPKPVVGVKPFPCGSIGAMCSLPFPRAKAVMEVSVCRWGTGVQEAQGCSQGDFSGDVATTLSPLP